MELLPGGKPPKVELPLSTKPSLPLRRRGFWKIASGCVVLGDRDVAIVRPIKIEKYNVTIRGGSCQGRCGTTSPLDRRRERCQTATCRVLDDGKTEETAGDWVTEREGAVARHR